MSALLEMYLEKVECVGDYRILDSIEVGCLSEESHVIFGQLVVDVAEWGPAGSLFTAGLTIRMIGETLLTTLDVLTNCPPTKIDVAKQWWVKEKALVEYINADPFFAKP